jgi:glycosyltransferase involved in cell wall biosynthesis
MRIGIDARELSGRPTGVGRYLHGLLREWRAADAAHGHELRLYTHAPPADPALNALVRQLPGSGGTVWEQRTLASAIVEDRIDVLFSPAYSTPLLTRVPRVVALHDISFAAHPEWYAWREGLRRRVLARRAAAASRRIITISEFSKSEIAARFGVAPSRIAVIPPGIDPHDVGSPPAPSPGGDPSLPLLSVGSIFNRRHIPELIAAFSTLAGRNAGVSLQLVGDNRSHPYQDIEGLIASSPASSRIHWHRYAGDEQLRDLYRHARAFVFLSEYEGLGLTPLEALSAGVPALLLDTPVARESCGAAAHYVTLGSESGLAYELERIVCDDHLRQALLAAAPATLDRYNWRQAADETMRVLEGAA